MNGKDSRLELLQQIPVLALRELIGAHLDDPEFGAVIRARFHSVLHRQPRDFQKALQRLTREQLTRLIIASPEISDDEIAGQFEEHRYGISPSFYIYLFDPDQLKRTALTGFRQHFEQALQEFNTQHEEGLPSVRRAALNDLGALRDRPEVTEATYRFQSRLDYIDENENAVSPYQTLYGFFWLNTADGYVILQARHPEVLKAICEAIEQAAGIRLTALVITKRFKNSLPFLVSEQMRFARLHDPFPDSPSFRWLSISDEKMYQKNYQMYESLYPEVRSARYRALLADVKETMLTVRCDQGALSLAGAIPASLFRDWCINSLGEIIRIHHQFRTEAAALVPTLDLASKAELVRFTSQQKERVLDLIVALLTVKGGIGADLYPLEISPLELAAVLSSYVVVQVPYSCQEPGCDPDEEQLVTCESCDENEFSLQKTNGYWELVCREHRAKRWTGSIPFKLNCRNGHPVVLNEEMLTEAINIVPVPDLLHSIADVINSYLKGHNFDPVQETFFIHGRNLWYFPDRGKAWTRILVIQNIGTVEAGGQVVGVASGQLGK
jgi:hypothetical protein